MKRESGKIHLEDFESILLSNCGAQRKEVHSGPQFGVDVSVIELPNGFSLAATSDPLSLIPSLGLSESAWLSVHLMANDMATTGFAPQYAQLVLNLPVTLSMDDFKTYWDYIHQYCKEIGIAITGGHTGFIEGQQSSIAGGGTLFTIAPSGQILLSKYAKPGDAILVTKECGLSSTAILAMCFPDTVQNRLGKEIYNEAAALFPKTSSLPDALAAVSIDRSAITAMHDVTEGGVLGAIYELATASGNGAKIYNDKLPISEISTAVCSLFSLDPRFCIGAGAMVITCQYGCTEKIIQQLAGKGIACTFVGEIVPKAQGIRIVEDNGEKAIPYTREDPYWAAFFQAIKSGWK